MGPGKLFSSDFSSLCTKPTLGNVLLLRLSQLQLRCSTSNSGQQASSPRSELSAIKVSSEERDRFCRADRNFQVKAWQATFKARNTNLKSLDDDVEKRKKKTRSTCEGHSRPPPSIDRRSPQPRSLQVSFQICRVWFL